MSFSFMRLLPKIPNKSPKRKGEETVTALPLCKRLQGGLRGGLQKTVDVASFS